jgi:hypothetical protein
LALHFQRRSTTVQREVRTHRPSSSLPSPPSLLSHCPSPSPSLIFIPFSDIIVDLVAVLSADPVQQIAIQSFGWVSWLPPGSAIRVSIPENILHPPTLPRLDARPCSLSVCLPPSRKRQELISDNYYHRYAASPFLNLMSLAAASPHHSPDPVLGTIQKKRLSSRQTIGEQPHWMKERLGRGSNVHSAA